MKKLKIKLSVLAVMVIVGILITISCSKDPVQNIQTFPKQTFSLASYQTIKNNHFPKIKSNYKGIFKRIWRAVKIGLADAGGAIVGFGTGYKVGGIVDGETGGSGWDIGLGITNAVAGGVLASVKASHGIAPTPTPPITTSNTGNPYDYIGDHHYAAVYKLQSTNPNIAICTDYDYTENLSICKMKLAELAPDIYPPYFAELTPSFVGGTVDYLEVCSDITYDKFMSYAEHPDVTSTISANAKEILLIYMDAMPYLAGSQDNEVFVQYSISTELEVVQDNSLNDSDKAFLLSVMSTSRHSIEYWSYVGE